MLALTDSLRGRDCRESRVLSRKRRRLTQNTTSNSIMETSTSRARLLHPPLNLPTEILIWSSQENLEVRWYIPSLLTKSQRTRLKVYWESVEWKQKLLDHWIKHLEADRSDSVCSNYHSRTPAQQTVSAPVIIVRFETTSIRSWNFTWINSRFVFGFKLMSILINDLILAARKKN